MNLNTVIKVLLKISLRIYQAISLIYSSIGKKSKYMILLLIQIYKWQLLTLCLSVNIIMNIKLIIFACFAHKNFDINSIIFYFY